MKDVPADLITKTKHRIHEELDAVAGKTGVDGLSQYYQGRADSHTIAGIIVAVCGICAFILIVAMGMVQR